MRRQEARDRGDERHVEPTGHQIGGQPAGVVENEIRPRGELFQPFDQRFGVQVVDGANSQTPVGFVVHGGSVTRIPGYSLSQQAGKL